MASKLSFTEEDLPCLVCHGSVPVLLPCILSVCNACLQELRRNTQKKECPVFKEMHATLNLALNNLCEKLNTFKTVKTKCDQAAEHIKVQAQNTETQMKEEFKMLHKYLHDKEEALITALREEEQQKSQMVKERIEVLNRDISTISNTIRDIEEELKAEHVSFLQNYKTTVEKVQLTPPDPQPVSGALIDVAGHLRHLAFGVWVGMGRILPSVSYHPVILDPNTAHRGLVLSDDLTSVSCGGGGQKLPENPERFGWWDGVLGSEGFDSGTHSWGVEVGDDAICELGVVVESNQRQSRGIGGQYWGIYVHRSGGYASSSSESCTFLSVNRTPQRIRVQLDWEQGKLSFFDADTNRHLHTFTATFTEKLIPYFCTRDNSHPVKILKMKIRILLDV